MGEHTEETPDPAPRREGEDPEPQPVVPQWHALASFHPLTETYQRGYEVGVSAGHQAGLRDLERARSEAASQGYSRGTAAAHAFPIGGPRKNEADGLAVLIAWVAGIVLGAILIQRRDKLRAERKAEVSGDELPDVRD